MKKALSFVLVICLLLVFAGFSYAEETVDEISLRLNSDIAGLTENDTEKLIEIRKGNVVYSMRGDGPVSIYDIAGTPEPGAVVAGRTYSIYYTLTAAEGYALPDKLPEGNLEIECGNGVKVISSQVVTAKEYSDGISPENFRGLMIFAQVKVDGSLLQRLYGFVYDMVLKIRAWSPY